MPENVVTYDFNDVFATVGGIPVEGYGPDGGVKIEHTEDAYSVTKGVDGTATRNRKRKATGRITFTVSVGSPVNAAFQALHLADLEGNAGVVPIFVQDNSTGSTYFAEQAWVMKTPDREIGEEIGTLEWVFETINITTAELGGVL